LSLKDRINEMYPMPAAQPLAQPNSTFSGEVVAEIHQKSYTPTMDGWLNKGWDWGWWQQDRQPLNMQGINATVEACVSALAQTLAMCPVYLMDEDEQGTKTRLRGYSPERVLHQPNHYETRSLFFNNLVRSVYYEGDGIAVAGRDERGAINQMHLMNARSTRAVMDPESGEVFYYASPKNNQPFDFNMEEDRIFPARNVFHLRLQTDRDPLKGITPIQAAANAIQANSAITGHQANFFTRMSRPSGALATDEKLGLEEMRQLREAFREQSAEMDSGGLPILSRGLKFEQFGLSSQDAETAAAFGMTVADISRAFRVPLPLINDMSGSTFNNAEALMGWFLASGLGFLLESVEQELGRLFSLSFSRSFNFDTTTLLRSDMETRVKALGEAAIKGLISPDEGRSMGFGLGPVADGAGAEPRVQQQVIPLSAWELALTKGKQPEAPSSEDMEAAFMQGIEKGLGDES
jgi:HK97 family phage portal protein